jgi:hypothetical protein
MSRLCSFLFIVILSIFGVSNLYAKSDYKYSYLPKVVYENQIFPITVLEIDSVDNNKISFIFDKNSQTQPISKKPLLVKNGKDTFHTFYFKAQNKSITLPSLVIKDDYGIVVIKKYTISITKLKYRDDFCGVLSADMKIKTSQASTYDESNNLVTLSIEAYEANIENMHLRDVVENGIENIKRKGAKVIAEFYVVIPVSQKKLRFTYFNTIKEQYIYLDINIDIKDSTVSTQSQINPKDDNFDRLKKYLFMSLILLFLILFLWKKDFFYLLLMFVSVAILSIFYLPKDKICISQGTPLYILPTNGSRICSTIDEEFTADVLGERAKFYKVEYSNGVIGWIKDENICKD